MANKEKALINSKILTWCIEDFNISINEVEKK